MAREVPHQLIAVGEYTVGMTIPKILVAEMGGADPNRAVSIDTYCKGGRQFMVVSWPIPRGGGGS